MNKWEEWENFKHVENSAAPRAVFYQGCFNVYLDRRKIYSYNRTQELAKKKRMDNMMQKSRSSEFVEKETNDNMESQQKTFEESQKSLKADSESEDPLFNPTDIAFKCR